MKTYVDKDDIRQLLDGLGRVLPEFSREIDLSPQRSLMAAFFFKCVSPLVLVCDLWIRERRNGIYPVAEHRICQAAKTLGVFIRCSFRPSCFGNDIQHSNSSPDILVEENDDSPCGSASSIGNTGTFSLEIGEFNSTLLEVY